MDKYEFQIKTEQLEKQLDRKNYETAAKIADSIDWRKVRNVGLLMEVAEAYEYTERFEDCYEILNIAYDCAPIGRMIVYKMAEVAVRMEDYNEAVESSLSSDCISWMNTYSHSLSMGVSSLFHRSTCFSENSSLPTTFLEGT